MTHNITVLQRYGTYWYAPSQRLFHVTLRGGTYEARHAVSWYVGRGATLEAALIDAARGWNDTPPSWDQIMASIDERIVA